MGVQDLNRLIDDLISREGGYSNHPADKGGPTNWGVTEQVARAYGYTGPIRSLPRDTAVGIYKSRYWFAPNFSDVAVRYPTLAVELFDIGVNMGVAVAAKFLQRALNALNNQAGHYPDITVDGVLGRMSFEALDAFVRRRKSDGEAVLMEAVRSLRGARYIEISESRPANEAFTYGWFSRMVEMAKGAFR